MCLRRNVYQRGITGQKHSRAIALARAYIAPCFFLLPPPLFPPQAARRRGGVSRCPYLPFARPLSLECIPKVSFARLSRCSPS